jgi:two-component system OmpR family response regulator
MTETANPSMQRRILIVDDEPDMTFLVRLNLQKTGRYEVREENESPNALPAAREFRPDLILLDVMMPELDGGDVLALLKEDHQLRSVPVVFLTATVLKDEVSSQGGTIGGYPFISKPFEVETLVSRIDQLLDAKVAPAVESV